MLFNDGAVKGRCAAARRILGEPVVDPDALVVEPYANPFRTYPLVNDYKVFKQLFEESGVDCYILNTCSFMDKDVKKEITLGALETIVEKKGGFRPFGIDGLEIFPIDGYAPDFSDAKYKKQFIARMNDRIGFIEAKDTVRGGYDKLPKEALDSMKKVAEAAQKL